MTAFGRSIRRAIVAFAATAATFAAAATADVAGQPPIELPKFEVVDSRLLPKPESWSYAEIPGFEILSNISARDTRRFTRDFLLLQEVIQAIMPVMTRSRSDVPTALVLCGRGNGFNEFLPADKADQEFSANTLFFENTERTAIVVDFALAELNVEGDTRIEADPYRSFYREYFRFLIRRQIGSHAPAWIEEGLVQLFAGIDFDKKWISFGLVGTEFGGDKAGDFNRLLVNHHLMPLQEMFTLEPEKRNAYWAAQCYAFVHLCLYSTGTKYQRPFIEFLSRLKTEPASEKLFQECFHQSYRDMLVELRGYLQYTAHTYLQYKTKKGKELPEPPAVAVRDATQSEVGRIKGEVLRLGGHADAAHLALIAPYVRGARDGRLLAALGLDEVDAGHDDRAQKFLEQAAREKAVRARAYLELGRLRYQAALAAPKRDGKLSREQLDYVFGPLNIARTQPPALAGVYALMIDVWSHAAERPKRDDVIAVLGGAQVVARFPALFEQMTRFAADNGLRKEALALAEYGEKTYAKEPTEQERFTSLAASLRHDLNAPDGQPTK